MNLRLQFLISLLLLVGVIVFFEMTEVDLWVSDHFYNFNAKHWVTAPYHHWMEIVFHSGLRILLILVGVACLAVTLFTFKDARLVRYRAPLALLVAALALVPGITAGSKHVTNVYCPDQIAHYNSAYKYPYVKTLESYPADFVPQKKGFCFPAGHASLGFAYMALFFVFPFQRRWQGLAVGLGLGWGMGIYQMAKGAHYLSHTLVTMISAWMIILLLAMFWRRQGWLK